MIHMQRAAAAGAHDPPVGAPWPPPTEHVTTHRAREHAITTPPTPRQATDGHRGHDEDAERKRQRHQRRMEKAALPLALYSMLTGTIPDGQWQVGGQSRLVRAANQAQVRNHIARDTIKVSVASPSA